MNPAWAGSSIRVQAAFSRVLTRFKPGRVALLHPGRVGGELFGGLLKATPRIHWLGEFVTELVHPLLDPSGDYSGKLVGRLGMALDFALARPRAGRHAPADRAAAPQPGSRDRVLPSGDQAA